MDQHTPDTLPSVELPSPQAPEHVPEAGSQVDMYSEQVSSKQLEKTPQPSAPDPVNAQAAAQPQTMSPPMLSPYDDTSQGTTGNSSGPQIAEDTDLIEKEWVERAKRIVEHTRHDPHLQTQEMSNMKADYIKKRYNKDIKLSD